MTVSWSSLFRETFSMQQERDPSLLPSIPPPLITIPKYHMWLSGRGASPHVIAYDFSFICQIQYIQNCTQNQVLNDILVSHGLGDFKFLTLSLIFKVFYSAFPKKLTNNSQPNVKHRGPSQICSYLNQTIKIHLQV